METTKPVSLQQFKAEKLDKKIIEDVDKILVILSEFQDAISKFKNYKPVQEIISIVQTNKTLFTIAKKKHEKNSKLNQIKE